ncbi:hypothetical protein BGZ94_001554 [Podila epigama]|nr:hypothetical protein BGZ94_001554 [Podila epigama]
MLNSAQRRRLIILSVPIVNCIFLVLFIFSPESLPRLPKRFSSLPAGTVVKPKSLEDAPIEYIRFGRRLPSTQPEQQQEQQQQGQQGQQGQQESSEKSSLSNNNTTSNDIYSASYLLEQRRLVQGVYLEPLPDHLITTYQSGYLHRYGAQPQQQKSPSDKKDESTTQPRPSSSSSSSSSSSYTPSTDEKYLTFLPHSGFHNQRSELENALVLARLLNRTLIIPKVYLGPPMPWLTFHLLHSRLLYQTKIGLDHCRALIDDQFDDDEDEHEHGAIVMSDTERIGGNAREEAPKRDTGTGTEQEGSMERKPAEGNSRQVPFLNVPSREQPSDLQNELGQVQQVHNQSPEQQVQQQEQPQGLPQVQPQQQPQEQPQEQLQEQQQEQPQEQPQEQQQNRESPEDMAAGPGSSQNPIRVDDVHATEGFINTYEMSSPERDDMTGQERNGQEEDDRDDAGNGNEAEEEDQDKGEDAVSSDNVEDEGDEEDEPMEPSWIEVSEDGERDQSYATGDGVSDLSDLEGLDDFSDEESQGDVQDWGSVEEDEEGDQDSQDALVGIVDGGEGEGEGGRGGGSWEQDDEDGEQQDTRRSSRDSANPSFQRHHHHHHLTNGRRRTRGRILAQDGANIEAASLPLYMPYDTSNGEKNLRVWKKRSLDGQPAEETSHQHLEKRQQHPLQQNEQRQAQQHPSLSAPPVPVTKKQKKLRLLPAECLHYESWSMADWDLFFDLDPLRRYVRIASRESISMAFLESEFGIQIPKDEEVASNSTAATMDDHGGSGGDGGGGSNSEDNDGKDSSSSNEGEESGDGTEDSEKEPPLLRTAGDVLFFDDNSLYDYMFSENPDSIESAKVRPKYRNEFTIEWLAARPEKLIHLGSIFGTGRVNIDSLESKAWLMKIRDHLIIRTEILQKTSQRIAEKISGSNLIDVDVDVDVDRVRRGGMGGDAAGTDQGSRLGQQSFKTQTSHAGMVDPMDAGFVGIHIRMSDGHFSLSARKTIENIRRELLWQMDMPLDEYEEEQEAPLVYDQMHDVQKHHDRQQQQQQQQQAMFKSDSRSTKKKERMTVEECRARALAHREQLLQPEQQDSTVGSKPRRRSNGRYTPIYLATDAHRPRSNPIFDKLFATFDCIFTLDDFEDELEPLHHFRNPEDGVHMAKFMIPMVDAMVVARSAAFFGTPASTFSNYIQRQLRPAYTGLYD